MKRLKIGLVFFFNYKIWAGGVIYILNIISSLNLLDDDLKPELIIYCNDDSPIEDIKSIHYPYIKFFKFKKYPPDTLGKVLNFVFIKLFNSTYFFDDKPELVYPYVKYLSYGNRPIFWIPDFQEYYFPGLFDKKAVVTRMKRHAEIAKNNKGVLVLSSQSALNDFTKFYPNYVCKTALVRFASILPDFKHLSTTDLKTKFGICENYFMVVNQFWVHKNHKVILEAVNILKKSNIKFQVALTGSTSDKRNPKYFESLQEFIKTNQLEEYMVFLGFIDREEQLKLMDESLAIIQPSLFEGWSTVVEDAKAISQYIILSKIDVHIEQINENCSFFNPYDAVELASIMENTVANKYKRVDINYTGNIIAFGKEFINVITDKGN